jgi:hypothetical protein
LACFRFLASSGSSKWSHSCVTGHSVLGPVLCNWILCKSIGFWFWVVNKFCNTFCQFLGSSPALGQILV